MLQKLLLKEQTGQLFIESVKKIDIKQVVAWVPDAMSDISALTLTRSWNKLSSLCSDKTAKSDQQPAESDK